MRWPEPEMVSRARGAEGVGVEVEDPGGMVGWRMVWNQHCDESCGMVGVEVVAVVSVVSIVVVFPGSRFGFRSRSRTGLF